MSSDSQKTAGIHRSMQERFDTIIERVIPYGERVAVAVSGGADSMALFLLLKNCRAAYKLTVLIVDHDLRPESPYEAIGVAEKIKGYGVNACIIPWVHGERGKPSSNVQQHARRARYILLEEYCKQHSIKYLCTGHQLDDKAETMLMNILRGTGVTGISGIRDVARLKSGLQLIRPLLTFTRTELESYLTNMGEENWVMDPSNISERYQRTHIRKLLRHIGDSGIMGLNHELIHKRLVLLADNARRNEDFVMRCVNREIARVTHRHSSGAVFIDKSKLVDLDEEVALRLLRWVLQKVGGGEYVVRLRTLLLLYQRLIETAPSYLPMTAGGCLLSLASSALLRRELGLLLETDHSRNSGDNMPFILVTREASLQQARVPLFAEQELIWDRRFKILLQGEASDEQLYVGAIGSAITRGQLKSHLSSNADLTDSASANKAQQLAGGARDMAGLKDKTEVKTEISAIKGSEGISTAITKPGTAIATSIISRANKSLIPCSRILTTLPAIYNAAGDVIYLPTLGLYSTGELASKYPNFAEALCCALWEDEEIN